MKIYVDSRETKKRKDKVKKFFGDEPIIKQMEFGDYVYKDIAIEFKTTEDFINSIKDKRAFRQAIGMNEKYKQHYFIIYGNMKKTMKNLMYEGHYFSVNQYLGALASLVQTTNILIVDNETQAFKLAKKIFEKGTDNKNRDVYLTPKQTKEKNKLIAVLMLMGNMSSTNAEKLVNELNIKSFEDIIKLDKDKIMEVDGFGVKRADVIMKWVKGE